MNKKILHVVSSDAVKERVFQLINSSKNEEIVVCPTSLDYGILPKNYTKKELTATKLFLCKSIVVLIAFMSSRTEIILFITK